MEYLKKALKLDQTCRTPDEFEAALRADESRLKYGVLETEEYDESGNPVTVTGRLDAREIEELETLYMTKFKNHGYSWIMEFSKKMQKEMEWTHEHVGIKQPR